MSYDPSNDMAGFPKLFDKYMQATASTFRPNVEEAIRIAEELENRASRVRSYWQSRKRQCPQQSSSPSGDRG